MAEIKGQKILGLLGVFLFFNLLLFGLSPETQSDGRSDPETAQGRGEEKENRNTAPKGQTFYKWSDADGNLYFTDDLAKVPKPFRDRIEIFELPPLREEETETYREPSKEEAPPPLPSPVVREVDRRPEEEAQPSGEPYVYKEIPFDQFIRITVGMDEAEVLSRIGFPSLVTPSDYFYGERARYRYRIIRLIYLGNRELHQKTTVIEIRNGRVVNIERIFPF